ncbi:hypothetical protein B566_EDAN006511 [Ephemera danica]|nr:hypothetical protein B566_EDAN006511 [Ephemera danica]
MADGTSTGADKAAIRLIVRAVELDKENRLTESLMCYQEGIGLLMEAIKGMIDKARADAFRAKVKTYLTRAEQIKSHIASEKEKGKYKEHITISAGATGYSYNSVMGRFLDPEVIWVQVEDPYIRQPHQI